MPIQAPTEFKKVFRNMGQDFAQVARTKEEFVLFALSGVDRAEALRIWEFLTSEFAAVPDNELLAWWRTSTTGTYFHSAAGLREFLADMRRAVSAPPFV